MLSNLRYYGHQKSGTFHLSIVDHEGLSLCGQRLDKMTQVNRVEFVKHSHRQCKHCLRVAMRHIT